jgi:hypothetical protein
MEKSGSFKEHIFHSSGQVRARERSGDAARRNLTDFSDLLGAMTSAARTRSLPSHFSLVKMRSKLREHG